MDVIHLLCYEGLNGFSAVTSLHLLLNKHTWGLKSHWKYTPAA